MTPKRKKFNKFKEATTLDAGGMIGLKLISHIVPTILLMTMHTVELSYLSHMHAAF